MKRDEQWRWRILKNWHATSSLVCRSDKRHFVKLIAFQFDPQLRHHFRTELRSGLNKIQRIRLKPNARTGAFEFYFDPLFDYPFGGVEIHNTRALMEFISSEYDGIRPTILPEEMTNWLK
jgi:hypothetical protein